VRDTREVCLEINLHDAPRHGCTGHLELPGTLVFASRFGLVAVGAVMKICLKDRLPGRASWPSAPTRSSTVAMPSGLVPPFGLGISTTRTGCELVLLLAQCLVQFLYHLLFVPCVDNPLDRHAIDTRRPPCSPSPAARLPRGTSASPDLVIQTVKPLLLVLLGCAIEGSL